MSTAITPTYIQNFETNLTFRMTNAWSRTLKNLWFPRTMVLQSSGTLLEYIEWMLETARIQPTGPKGASINYDPLAAISQTLEHDHFGNGLRLYRPDIEDDDIARAVKWGTDTGGAQAYWPQRGLVNLMQNGKSANLNGKSNLAYDGGVFFRTNHPINPYDVGQGTYSNLHIGTPFTALNLARLVAYIESIRHGGDAPMGAMPVLIAVPTNWRLRATQTLGAESFTDVLNATSTAAAAASNSFKASFQFEPPIVAPEFNNEPDVFYVGTAADQDAFDSAFIYIEREAFSVNTYSPLDQASLARIQTFEWANRGRNGFAYGHPYRWHRCESAGSQPSYLADLDI